MIESLIILLFFAVAYAIKGGSGNVLENWDEVRHRNRVFERLMDGKVLSTVLVFGFSAFYSGFSIPYATTLALAWLIAVAPSMGEEHGAIGYFTLRSWDAHDNLKDKIRSCFVELDGYERHETYRGRMYDVKKGLQRGVWMGAAMALATGSTEFILASLLFVPAVFIGQTINRIVLRTDGWTLAEPVIGAAVFGVGFLL